MRTSVWSDVVSKDHLDEKTGFRAPPSATAAANTLILASYKFDSGATCTAQGWTSVDVGRLTQTGDYWHVDDFALSNSLGSIPPGQITAGGLQFTPIQGTKSMWMGQRIPPAGPVDTIHCSYLALPGYGDNWVQSFGPKTCLSVAGGATPGLDIAFKLKFDTQPSYDLTALEYTQDCSGDTGWIKLDGGIPWSGAATITVAGSYAVGAGPIRVRLRFVSNFVSSNEDGIYPGFGVAVDSLSIEGSPVEDFEDEALGSHEGNDWTSYPISFGNYLGLFKKFTGANYEDECLENLSCYWAAINGSTEFYTCGTPPQPTQKVVPHKNVRNEYLANEIWSPVIPLAGSGTEYRLRYTVYRDLPLDNLVFHRWRVRSIYGVGCPGPWRSRNVVYYGDTKDWAIVDHSVGPHLGHNTSVALQVAIGVIDMCEMWCGVFGTGACHSAGPYIDQVKVLRVDTVGPQWDVRAIDTFQDNFSANGTITGTARADAAIDTKPAASASFTPGDSAIALYLLDPKYVNGAGTNSSGLLNDPNVSTFIGRHKTKKQVYMWVQVWPYDGTDNPGDKVGAELSEGPGGQANRYPFIGTQVIDAKLWTKIRMDYTYTGTATNPGIGDTSPSDPYVRDRFNVDLNDILFTPGDTIYYFFGATSTDGTNYHSTEYGTTTDISAVAANPMEFTILPAGGFNRGGYILYVDGADGLGNQPYFDGALMALGLNEMVDRYDVRDPSAGVANRLAGRVTNVSAQLSAAYHFILWDTGSLSVTLGDGPGNPVKTNDYGLLNTFLGNLVEPGGVYLCGDDLPERLDAAGASGVTFRNTYMPFTLINSNHRLSPTLFQISPTIAAWPGRAFSDNFFIFGGCPQLNDFDVVGANGASLVQMSYNTASNANGAVVSHKTGNAAVVMSGFSFAYLRDNELDGVPDRAKHLLNILWFLGLSMNPIPEWPSGVGDSAVNRLAQNYPNPFNPTTTIAFSIKTRAHVSLQVYNVAGQLVRTLANEVRASGAHSLAWNGHDNNGVPVSSGVYFYRLVAGDFTQTKKMVLLK